MKIGRKAHIEVCSGKIMQVVYECREKGEHPVDYATINQQKTKGSLIPIPVEGEINTGIKLC